MRSDDKLMIAETIYLYAIGIDTKDFDLYGSIFADQVNIDFSSYEGSSVPETTVLTRDQWVSRVRPLFTGLAATQHSMTNPVVNIDGDTASCRMYMRLIMSLSPRRKILGLPLAGITMTRCLEMPNPLRVGN